MVEFKDIFSVRKPIIGMIHLAGDKEEKVERAVREMEIYDKYLVNGVIIGDYHGDVDDVYEVLEAVQGTDFRFAKGVNILGDYEESFMLADEFGASFIQIDCTQFSSGSRKEGYLRKRSLYEDIAVLGGVRSVGRPTITRKSLEQDIESAMPLCEAIVITRNATGEEIPIRKLEDFDEITPEDYPLINGTGVNRDNLYEQMRFVNGAIIGDGLKLQRDTKLGADPEEVKYIMNQMKGIRKLG